jgi:hypothetical protein
MTQRLDLDALRARARAIKQVAKCPIGHAYEQLAKTYGYRTWAALLIDQRTRS